MELFVPLAFHSNSSQAADQLQGRMDPNTAILPPAAVGMTVQLKPTCANEDLKQSDLDFTRFHP